MSLYYQNNGQAIQIGGGINQSVLDRIDALEQREQALKTELQEAKSELRSLKEQKAGTNLYGLAKISGDSTVTIDEGLVLSAKEKNASVSGTLANQISQVSNAANRLKVHTKQENVVFTNGKAVFVCNLREQGFSGVFGAFVNLVATNDTCAASITDMNIAAFRLCLDARSDLNESRQARVTYIGA